MASYFIDYENVRGNGFNGINSLTEKDQVYIFYTDNADSLTFGLHRRLQECPAEIHYIKVATGRNALDFQLSSYLGYQMALAPEESYTVVSRDNGFMPLIHFWNKKHMQVEMRPDLAQKMGAEEEFIFHRTKTPLLTGGKSAEHWLPTETDGTETDSVSTEETKESHKKTGAVGKLVKSPAEETENPAECEEAQDDLFEAVRSMIAYPDQAENVWKYVTKYKTKQGLNNALVKAYGSDVAGEIYKSIKPLLADKKAR